MSEVANTAEEAHEPGQIAALTLEHYNRTADQFRHSTWDHDVSQNIDALLRHIRASPPYRILDFGCGPGRDLCAIRARGHVAVGLDGAEQFVQMARSVSGCEVWHQDFLRLALPAHYFDGIFANASLFHVPSLQLPRVLSELHATLKPGGVLFSSNPRGDNEEGWNRGRYGAFHDLAAWQGYLKRAGFVELEHYFRPVGLPCEQQPWLASVWATQAGVVPLPNSHAQHAPTC
ncbi:MAG TPA: class I SAM-dependent methyltransferase [Steroidobacteraceae bacterium]|jgi:SAM-dependent methyltransferase